MITSRRSRSSARRWSAWLIVITGLVFYAGIVLGQGMSLIPSRLPVPWWAVLAIPPIVYAIIVRLAVGHVPLARWAAGTLCLWGVHVVLGVLTAVALTTLRSDSAADAFPSSGLP